MAGAGTQITVALISVGGVITAAMIANWGKFDATPAPAPAPYVAPAPAPEPVAAATVAPPVEELKELGAAQARTIAASTSVLDDIAGQIESSVAPNIGGQWRDNDGFTYAVVQQGADYAFQQFQNGALVGVGQGRIDGRTMRHEFVGTGGQGVCEGEASDGVMAGTCSSGGQSWPFRVVR